MRIMASQTTGFSGLLIEQFVQAKLKEIILGSNHWRIVMEIQC